MNFGPSGLIGWYAGEECLIQFDFHRDRLPFSGDLTSPLNATVKITSVIQSGSFFNFINFTLTAPVSNFLAIRGLAVTCGTLGMKSEGFSVHNFTLFGIMNAVRK